METTYPSVFQNNKSLSNAFGNSEFDIQTLLGKLNSCSTIASISRKSLYFFARQLRNIKGMAALKMPR